MLVVAQTQSITAKDGTFTALFRSRRLVEGKELRELGNGKRIETWDGFQLFGQDDSVRVIRNKSVTLSADSPYVQMTNGDVVPGRVVRYVESGNEEGLPAHFDVELKHDSQTVQTSKPPVAPVNP